MSGFNRMSLFSADDISEDLFFDFAVHKFLGPVLQKVYFPHKWDSFGTNSM